LPCFAGEKVQQHSNYFGLSVTGWRK